MLFVTLAFFLILFAIFFIILFHELGHFLMASISRVKIERIVIGFGPVIWQRKSSKHTQFMIGCIPLGGYVKLVEKSFDHAGLFKKIMIIVAGPVANLFLAVLLFWSAYLIGVTYLIPVVGQVVPTSIADKAGIKSGSEILAINGTETRNWTRVMIALFSRIGSEGMLRMKIKTSDQIIEEKLLELNTWKLDPLMPNPLTALGISPQLVEKKPPPPELLRTDRFGVISGILPALDSTYAFGKFNLLVLKKLVTGEIGLRSLVGPLGIATLGFIAIKQGIAVFLAFMAIISLSVGIVNLLPIPSLDGANLLFQIIQRIFRIQISLRWQLLLFRLGLILLLLLFIQVIIGDLLRLIH